MSKTAFMPTPVAGISIEQRGELAPSLEGELMAADGAAVHDTILAHDMAAGQIGAGAEALGMVESPDRGIIQRIADKMAGSSTGRKILGTAVGLMGAGAGIGTAVASASGTASENNLVCGGVHSKKQALRLAHGGADKCGHTDIGEAWAEVGITPEVIKTMHWGTVSSEDGLTSEGRLHGPQPSKDKPVRLDSGSKIFLRPLSVWGDTTYKALVGHTEDGREVAILEGCGNGEGHQPPHKKPPQHPPKTPKKPHTGFVNVWKHALTATDELIVPTPSGTFQFDASCKVPGQKKRVHNTFTYNPNGKDRPVRALTGCKVGSVAIVRELSTLGPDQWEMLSPVVQKQQVDPGKNLFTYKDRQVPHIGPPPPPPPAPNLPPSGEMAPPMHLYVNGEGKVCVTNLSDPEGDPLTVSNFTATDPNGNPVGHFVGGVFPEASGSAYPNECIEYDAPANPGQVSYGADVYDGHESSRPQGTPVHVFDNGPIFPDDFGGN